MNVFQKFLLPVLTTVTLAKCAPPASLVGTPEIPLPPVGTSSHEPSLEGLDFVDETIREIRAFCSDRLSRSPLSADGTTRSSDSPGYCYVQKKIDGSSVDVKFGYFSPSVILTVEATHSEETGCGLLKISADHGTGPRSFTSSIYYPDYCSLDGKADEVLICDRIYKLVYAAVDEFLEGRD